MLIQFIEIETTAGNIDPVQIITVEKKDEIQDAAAGYTAAYFFKNKKGIKAKYAGQVNGRRQVVIKILNNLIAKRDDIKTISQY